MKLLIFSILFPVLSFAKTIRVGVIDTGFDPKNTLYRACPGDLNRDFTGEGMLDTHPHGQNIVNAITDRLKDVDYCIVIIKGIAKERSVLHTPDYILALNYAMMLKLDVVNLSISGENEMSVESLILSQMITLGTVVVAAAGNDRKDLDKKCNYYPACADSRIVTVGCLQTNLRAKCPFTNYGKYVKVWELGEDVLAGGVKMSGTSQATAIATAKIVRRLANERR